LTRCKLEPSLQEATTQQQYQFERTGYFVLDKYSKPGEHVFNRTVTLRDTWARIDKQNA
jgi:glutaminyl-tRNA synthetase